MNIIGVVMLDFFLFLFVFIVLILAVNKTIKFSSSLLILLLFSIITNVALAQNYTQSLIPEANDGLGISNLLAYMVIGEDRWSHELFQSTYNLSTILSMVLLIVYVFTLIIENFLKEKAEKNSNL